MSNIKYYKITNHNEIHHGYVYKDGLNVLDKPFEEEGTCVPGGLYFTTIENIPKFYDYGINLREVILPENDSDFKMVKDGDDKYRANKIILGKKYSLYNLETYKIFNLDILDNHHLIDIASVDGHIHILEWWKNSGQDKSAHSFSFTGLELTYSNYALHGASINERINVLEWWKNSGFELKYTDDILDCASRNGHVNVLEWWKNSGFELKYSYFALDWASRNGHGHVEVLEWWKNSGLELKYSKDALGKASEYGYVNVLEWWKNSGLKLKYSDSVLNRVLDQVPKNVKVLEWWKNSGLLKDNIQMSNIKYYKVTNRNEIHHGYAYKDGLNILDKPFEEKESCVPGGLYFTTIENIPKFYDYGINLREVMLPENDNDFKMIKDGEDKYRANKIILGKKYSLYDPETYEKFKLNILDNHRLIDLASGDGYVNVLEWLKNPSQDKSMNTELINETNSELKYSSYALNMASSNGHINVLEWWKRSGLKLKYTSHALNEASENGHVNVLEWWKKSGLKLKYTDYALDRASRDGHVNVLEWWKNSNLELKYTYYALNEASMNGHVNVLEWWKNSCLILKYSHRALDFASENEQVNVLEWWKNSGLKLKYINDTPFWISISEHVNVLKWWEKSGLIKDN